MNIWISPCSLLSKPSVKGKITPIYTPPNTTEAYMSNIFSTCDAFRRHLAKVIDIARLLSGYENKVVKGCEQLVNLKKLSRPSQQEKQEYQNLSKKLADSLPLTTMEQSFRLIEDRLNGENY